MLALENRFQWVLENLKILTVGNIFWMASFHNSYICQLLSFWSFSRLFTGTFMIPFFNFLFFYLSWDHAPLLDLEDNLFKSFGSKPIVDNIVWENWTHAFLYLESLHYHLNWSWKEICIIFYITVCVQSQISAILFFNGKHLEKLPSSMWSVGVSGVDLIMKYWIS